MVLSISKGSGLCDSIYTRPDRQSSKLSLTIYVSCTDRMLADKLEDFSEGKKAKYNEQSRSLTLKNPKL